MHRAKDLFNMNGCADLLLLKVLDALSTSFAWPGSYKEKTSIH